MNHQPAKTASNSDARDELAKYVVLNEHTLCYRVEGSPTMLGVLHGNVQRGGHHWQHGPVTFTASCCLRAATLEDFDFYRVSPKGHIC
ncbi:hypothetical protein [Pseudomonas sp. MWU12-2323]|uniref:hypothetical protein n=1 Tax=Pseudomonas sp. MWU12-2323 TaxID=2651296 RepID=UPI00128B00A0|nr:hypothetical protein [Pseudomonas sp. MWU12-2323]MPQ69463.1 hypothetical protein [Pseudomonas sp. MWU12-2323]